MKFPVILAVSLMSFLFVPASQANRLPCVGSKGERSLAQMLAYSDELNSVSLQAILAEVATTTGTKMSTFELFENGASASHNEYKLIDPDERYVVTVTEISSTKVRLGVERACQSETAGGWQGGWSTAIALMKQHGFSFDNQNF
jgi:hypothetical protein